VYLLPDFGVVSCCRQDLGSDEAIQLVTEKILTGPSGTACDITKWQVWRDGIKQTLQYVKKYTAGPDIRMRYTKVGDNIPAQLIAVYTGHNRLIASADGCMLAPQPYLDCINNC
jgi:hypothetical protein